MATNTTFLTNFWDRKRTFRRLVKNTIRYSNFVDTFSIILSLICAQYEAYVRAEKRIQTMNSSRRVCLNTSVVLNRSLQSWRKRLSLSEPLYLSIDRDTVECREKHKRPTLRLLALGALWRACGEPANSQLGCNYNNCNQSISILTASAPLLQSTQHYTTT